MTALRGGREEQADRVMAQVKEAIESLSPEDALEFVSDLMEQLRERQILLDAERTEVY